MASFNRVLLIGNLTRDPELRTLPSGTSVCDTGIATNRKFRSPDGQDREETCFVDLVFFGKQAQILHQYKKKGDMLFVEGRLKFESWQGNDGAKRSKHRVVVENFQFLGARGGRGAETGEYAASAPSPMRAQGAPSHPNSGFGGAEPGYESAPPDYDPGPGGEDNLPF